jgi:hypothetical protein
MKRLDCFFFFDLSNRSSSTVALGFTMSRTERLARKADNLTAIYEPIV